MSDGTFSFMKKKKKKKKKTRTGDYKTAALAVRDQFFGKFLVKLALLQAFFEKGNPLLVLLLLPRLELLDIILHT